MQVNITVKTQAILSRSYLMDNGYKIYEQAEIAFKKLKVNDGDIIIITFPSDIEPKQMELFGKQISPLIPEDVTVLCTRSGVTVETLPKDVLNAAGWYKFDTTKSN